MTLIETLQRLPTGLRRSLALLLVMVTVVAIFGLTVAPLLHLRNVQHQWRESAQATLARSKAAAGTNPIMQQRVKAIEGSALWSRLYPKGARNNAGAIQSDVSALLTAVNAPAQMMTPVAAVDLRHLRKRGVRFTASMRIDQLQRFLTACDQNARYLRVEKLTVSAPQQQTSEENPPLAITAEIYGFEQRAGGDKAQIATSAATL